MRSRRVRRSSRFFVPATALVLGCAAGVAVLLHVRSGAEAEPRAAGHAKPASAKPASKPVAARHAVLFGISDPELIHLSAAGQAKVLRRMRAIGINSIRFDANWDWVQFGGQDSFDWTMLDREVHSARAAGMTVELVIDGCPPWARLPGSGSESAPQPASAQQFATWAAEVAARYRPSGVNDFEIWNEPNDVKFWQPKANPAFYTKMLADSYRAIRKADPAAFVIVGGLAPVESRHGSLSAIAFLQAIYAHGGKSYFNAVATHPYSFPALPETYEPWSAWSQMSQTSPSLRSVMTAHGDGSKQLWITEFGAPSSGPSGVGAAGQAAELTQAIALAKSSSWIRALYVYTWQDMGTNARSNADWFGLLTHSGQRKLAYAAVAKALGK